MAGLLAGQGGLVSQAPQPFSLEQCCQEQQAAVNNVAAAIQSLGNQLAAAITAAGQLDANAITGLAQVISTGLTNLQADLDTNFQGLASVQAEAIAQLDADQKASIAALIQALQTGLNQVATAGQQELQQLLPSLESQFSQLLSQLPQAVVAAIQPLTQNFTQLITSLNTALGGPLAAVAAALTKLASCVCPSIEDVATAINNATAANDVPQDIINRLTEIGAFGSEMGQLASGAPLSHVITAVLGSLARILGGVTGQVESGLGLMLQNLIEPWAKQLFNVISNVGQQFVSAAQAAAQSHGADFTGLFREIALGFISHESDFVKLIFEIALSIASPASGVTADNVEAVSFRTLGVAFTVGQVLHLFSELAGKLFYPISSVFSHNAIMAVDTLKYGDILNAFHRPFWQAFIGNRAQQKHNADYPTAVPGYQQGATLYARRKISKDQLDTLMSYGGLDPAWRGAVVAGVYRPPGMFVLRQIFQNRPYPKVLAQRLLEDAGIDPQFVPLINDGLEFFSSMRVQEQLLMEMATAYGAGVGTIQDIQNQAKAMGWSTASTLALTQRAAIMRQRTMVSKLTSVLEQAVADNAISAQQAANLLQAAGAESLYIQFEASLASIKLAVRAAVKAQSVARQEATQVWHNASSAAMVAYQRGEIDAAALTAALKVARDQYYSSLTAYGITPEELAPEQAVDDLLIAVMVANADAHAQMGQMYVYGRLLPREQAVLLNEQVSALEEQYRYSVITLDQLRTKLQGLGIPEENVNAVVAKLYAEPTHAGPQPPVPPL